MNIKFNYLDYSVEVVRINEHLSCKQWAVNVDGILFCSIIKHDLKENEHNYVAYSPYGERYHSGNDDENSIQELTKLMMNWLY